MNRSTLPVRILNFLFNQYQAVLGRGGQIDWARVTGNGLFERGKFIVKLNGAVAKGATSLTVDALPQALRTCEVLDFGPEASVTVTLSANKAIGQVSIAFTALLGPIPSGTVLNFGVNKQAVTTAAAATGATTVAVEALDTALVSGDVATYQGGRKLAELTADAAAAATALTVSPLQFAIADNAEANFDGTGPDDGRFIPAGTVMCRTAADKLIPRFDGTGTTPEIATEILQSDAYENSKSDAKSGFGTLIEAQVFENLLPDADATTLLIPSGYKTELVTSGARINFSIWSDSRATD